MENKPGCETCGFRGKYDANPKSLLGRLWRWHAGFCPGWKMYMTSLPEAKRQEIAERYGMRKYLGQ
ncbi:MAG: hypothetical protein MUC50_18555 [Myxococcota bacterium]|nr:hypothetical protein [Myxococcota bacterium]